MYDLYLKNPYVILSHKGLSNAPLITNKKFTHTLTNKWAKIMTNIKLTHRDRAVTFQLGTSYRALSLSH